ncbi:MAG: phage integrase N-terminal domain-containing protein [Casimicrobium sp.]
MKKRTIHDMSALADLRDGHWVATGRKVDGEDVFSAITHVFDGIRWLRKNGKPLSEKSKTDYGNHILRSYRDLADLGFHLRKPWNAEQKHIEALCRHWSTKRLGASLVQNRLAALSWFCAVMGRPGLIRSTHDYDHCFGDRSMVRHQAAETDKSPEGRGFQRDDVIAIAMRVDQTFGHMVMLQYALGLRDKEVLRARPLWDLKHGEKLDPDREHRYWRLPGKTGGAKGGRERIIFLRQGDWQMQAIHTVQAFMKKRDGGLLRTAMGWSQSREKRVRGQKAKPTTASPTETNLTSTQTKKGGISGDLLQYQEYCRRAGFTKQALGFTGHSFRHSFTHAELFANGFISVVKGRQRQLVVIHDSVTGEPVTRARADEVRAAQTRTSKQLGHGPLRSTAAYYGKTKLARIIDKASEQEESAEQVVVADGAAG